jgi:hypothetical protein
VADQVSDTAKIRFRLDDIRPDGLRGPPDGLVAVAYEFCVPTGERVYRDMMQIDPGLQVQPGARGRIACAHDQSLVTGTTNQPGGERCCRRCPRWIMSARFASVFLSNANGMISHRQTLAGTVLT